MSSPQRKLAERIRALRRRQFGPRGKERFARLVGVAPEIYEQFERGTVPAGDVLVRMCQVTGEDLQWLLTGVSARGTLVISGARDRHQDLLGRLARLLEQTPDAAGPVEAFLDLLSKGREARQHAPARLPETAPGRLLPVYEWDEIADRMVARGMGVDLARRIGADSARLPPPDERGHGTRLPPPAASAAVLRTRQAIASEPTVRETAEGAALALVTRATDDGSREFVDVAALPNVPAEAIAIRVGDDALSPMLRRDDVAIVVQVPAPRPGRPVVCRIAERDKPDCRIWLGESRGKTFLGRLDDGADETAPATSVLWRMEVLYRVRPAA